MKQRRVDEAVQLVPYYPNYRAALAWYQDLELCKQVDNRDEVYDLDLLKRMYHYLRQHRTIAAAGFDGSFPPQIRCETLKYTKYSGVFATNL